MEECTVGIVSRGSIYEGLTLFLMTRSGKPPAGAARQRLGRGAFSASDGAYGFRQPPRPIADAALDQVAVPTQTMSLSHAYCFAPISNSGFVRK